MKITVGRLKEIIEEELSLFKKLHEDYGYKRDESEYDVGDEDAEEATSSDDTGTEAVLADLKKVLEKWEEAEYESDESRWQEYAKDIQGLINQHEAEAQPEEHTEEECEEVHPDQSHEEWEAEQGDEEAEEEEETEEEEKSKPKKSKKSSGSGKKSFPYESKQIEQMVYQKLLTAFGGEE